MPAAPQNGTRRWHRLPGESETGDIAGEVYRPDRYRAAAEEASVDAPRVDFTTEGTPIGPWTLDGMRGEIRMGPDRFVDGAVFPRV